MYCEICKLLYNMSILIYDFIAIKFQRTIMLFVILSLQFITQILDKNVFENKINTLNLILKYKTYLFIICLLVKSFLIVTFLCSVLTNFTS